RSLSTAVKLECAIPIDNACRPQPTPLCIFTLYNLCPKAIFPRHTLIPRMRSHTFCPLLRWVDYWLTPPHATILTCLAHVVFLRPKVEVSKHVDACSVVTPMQDL